MVLDLSPEFLGWREAGIGFFGNLLLSEAGHSREGICGQRLLAFTSVPKSKGERHLEQESVSPTCLHPSPL